MASLQDEISTKLKDLNSVETTNTPINHLWSSFKTILNNARDTHVPSKYTSTRYSQPWFNINCKRAVRKKARRFRVYKRTNLPKDYEKYKIAQKEARLKCREAYHKFIKENVLENDGKSKKLFSLIKSKKSDVIGVSPLQDKGTIHTDDKDNAEILNNQFSSVFTTDDGTSPEVKGPKATIPIGDITFTKNGILKLLNELNPSKASGPDDISARILKECSEVIVDTLILIFTASLQQGKIPEEWKKATISPLFKGGNKNRAKAENYRPISLTSVTCKIMEHIIHSHVMNHLEKGKFLAEEQHGFRKNRSCETQLIQTVHNIAQSINNKDQVDSVLLDFSKAFDKVVHRKLLLKLDHYGVRGNIYSWISDFLSDRTQHIVVRGASSTNKPVTSGVPQGTVFGPLLFLVYINDMPLTTKSKLSLFADDSFLYNSISSTSDTNQLQNDLNKLTGWEKEWQMEFHPDKCKVVRFTNKRNTVDASYHIHGCNLEKVDKAKYLGVTLTKSLTWNVHINIICAKANHVRFFLQRNLYFTSAETRLQCYKTFIRPILEYASTVWDPVDNHNLESKIEMVQRKALRWIYNSWSYDVSPTILRKRAELKTLQERRSIAKLKMLHEIVYKTKHVDHIPNRQRCSNVKFQPILGRIKLYSSSFFPSTVRLWNTINNSIANIQDKEKFIESINDFI